VRLYWRGAEESIGPCFRPRSKLSGLRANSMSAPLFHDGAVRGRRRACCEVFGSSLLSALATASRGGRMVDARPRLIRVLDRALAFDQSIKRQRRLAVSRRSSSNSRFLSGLPKSKTSSSRLRRVGSLRTSVSRFGCARRSRIRSNQIKWPPRAFLNRIMSVDDRRPGSGRRLNRTGRRGHWFC
jgi:hypothetical protein